MTTSSSGPTFCAVFEDGTRIAMTTHCQPDKLDLKRGLKLAHAAWQSRNRTDDQPPAMVEARFETADGFKVLKVFSAGDLKGAAS